MYPGPMDTRHVARARFLVTASTACLVLAISAAARAAPYQVGPGKMYATLGAVAERLAAGDIVEVDGNNTYAGDVLLTKSGTATAKSTIRGVRIGGKQPVLAGGTNMIEVQGSDLVLEGFELTGGSFRCFYHHDGHRVNNVNSRAERTDIYYNWQEGALSHELELSGPDPAGGSVENLK